MICASGHTHASRFEADKCDGLGYAQAKDDVSKLTEERDDWQTKYEHVLGLLRDTKMKHGTCQPRSRKACTACNAQELLDQIVKDWKGFTMVLS